MLFYRGNTSPKKWWSFSLLCAHVRLPESPEYKICIYVVGAEDQIEWQSGTPLRTQHWWHGFLWKRTQQTQKKQKRFAHFPFKLQLEEKKVPPFSRKPWWCLGVPSIFQRYIDRVIGLQPFIWEMVGWLYNPGPMCSWDVVKRHSIIPWFPRFSFPFSLAVTSFLHAPGQWLQVVASPRFGFSICLEPQGARNNKRYTGCDIFLRCFFLRLQENICLVLCLCAKKQSRNIQAIHQVRNLTLSKCHLQFEDWYILFLHQNPGYVCGR